MILGLILALARTVLHHRGVRRAACVLAVLVPALAVARPAPRARPPRPRWQQLPMPRPMPAPQTHGTVAVGGASIYYATYGTSGDPVILLHGGLGNSDQWGGQLPALAARMRVIAIDSRGHGRSTRTRAPASYAIMAGDVIAVMDHLGIARAAFLGWSDGGEIALDLAIEHPERVTRLFVIGTNYDSRGSKPRGSEHATFIAYAAKCRADYQRMSPTPRGFQALVDWMLPVWRSPAGFTQAQLRAIRAPTVIADGDHDEIIELAQEQEMAQLIPNARLVVFPDTSHFALWQDPDDTTRAIVDFLAPSPAAPAAVASP